MDHYLDLQILDDPEFAAPQLMSALYNKLHRALVQLNSQHIGISLPKAKSHSAFLGKVLRLHGSAADLDALMCLSWLTGMRDHLAIGDLLPVPAQVQYRVVRRVQVQSNPERLRRRCIKRHDVDVAEATRRYPDAVAKQLDLPFVVLRSQSTGQQFRLFIEQGELLASPVAGVFSAYGLSASASIPWF